MACPALITSDLMLMARTALIRTIPHDLPTIMVMSLEMAFPSSRDATTTWLLINRAFIESGSYPALEQMLPRTMKDIYTICRWGCFLQVYKISKLSLHSASSTIFGWIIWNAKQQR